MHHCRTTAIEEQLQRGVIGNVLRASVSFSFLGDEDFFANNVRVQADGDPLGMTL